MHKTIDEAVDFAKQLMSLSDDRYDEVDVVICAPFTALKSLSGTLDGTRVSIGAQNVAWANEGAYTGEVSPSMLTDAGCTYVIVGHSERRTYFGENDTDIRRKVEKAFASGLKVIACVGESELEREKGLTEHVIGSQVNAIVSGLELSSPQDLIIAYEPIWAIGTGKTATSEEAGRVCGIIRKLVKDALGTHMADQLRVQYGGSVNPENIAQLMREEHIDGALVGGASLDATSFHKIVKG